eukprot:984125-Pyramimonas_sp.AAC.1
MYACAVCECTLLLSEPWHHLLPSPPFASLFKKCYGRGDPTWHGNRFRVECAGAGEECPHDRYRCAQTPDPPAVA